MKKLMMVVFMVLIFILFVGLQEKMAQTELEGKKPQQQSDPHDDTPCDAVDLHHLEVPEDFKITYSRGPTHAEWGADRSTSVAADGSYSIKESSFSRDEMKKITKVISEGKISADAVKRIYARVLKCHFFKLKKSYWNPNVRDGVRELMYVVERGRVHSVTTYYYRVDRFDSIKFALLSEVPGK